ACPASRLASPRLASTRSVRWHLGWRRSASSRSTREPASASAVARLRLPTVLPSAATALVTTITLGGAPRAVKRTAVRRLRNASATCDHGSRRRTRSLWPSSSVSLVPFPLLAAPFPLE